MKLKNNLYPMGKLLLGGSLLVTLAGCVGYVDRPRTVMYVEPPVVQAGVMIQDDFVYYPNYQIYYSNSRHQYAYHDGSDWIYNQRPRGVSIHHLQTSPSVHMDFHDSPAHHHQNVVQQYPKNWSPAHPEQGHDRNDNQHDQTGNRYGK